MPEAKIIRFETNSRAHRLRRELEDWRGGFASLTRANGTGGRARYARWRSVGSATWRAISRATTPNGLRRVLPRLISKADVVDINRFVVRLGRAEQPRQFIELFRQRIESPARFIADRLSELRGVFAPDNSPKNSSVELTFSAPAP